MSKRTPDIHVMPINDTREHEESQTCWCGPKLQHFTLHRGKRDKTVVTHHAADGRELVEQHGVN